MKGSQHYRDGRLCRKRALKSAWLLSVVVCLVSMAFTFEAPKAGADDDIRFQRTNHLVSDLDRALRVYRDVLGLQLEAVRKLPRGGYAYNIFQLPATADLRFAVFSTASQTNVLALTEVKTASAINLDGPNRFPRTGIVLESSDLDEVMARARREGLTVLDENRFVTSDGRAGRQRGLYDHDGNLIVIYKIPEGVEN